MWYDGRVQFFDSVFGICEVLYDDGEREELNLLQERFKVKRDVEVVEFFYGVLVVDGDVLKQFDCIGDVFCDIGKEFFFWCMCWKLLVKSSFYSVVEIGIGIR